MPYDIYTPTGRQLFIGYVIFSRLFEGSMFQLSKRITCIYAKMEGTAHYNFFAK